MVRFLLNRFRTDMGVVSSNYSLAKNPPADARIAKVMLYDFVNNFGSLFYVSVVKIWLQVCHDGVPSPDT